MLIVNLVWQIMTSFVARIVKSADTGNPLAWEYKYRLEARDSNTSWLAALRCTVSPLPLLSLFLSLPPLLSPSLSSSLSLNLSLPTFLSTYFLLLLIIVALNICFS